MCKDGLLLLVMTSIIKFASGRLIFYCWTRCCKGTEFCDDVETLIHDFMKQIILMKILEITFLKELTALLYKFMLYLIHA